MECIHTYDKEVTYPPLLCLEAATESTLVIGSCHSCKRERAKRLDFCLEGGS